MIGNKSIVSSLISYSAIVVSFLISTGLTLAQTSNPIAEKSVTDSSEMAPVVRPDSTQEVTTQCKRSIKAEVVAVAQPIMLNRLGAAIPGGMLFALRRDTQVVNGQVQLRTNKRPRPIVLRANVGDCVTITLTNAIQADKSPQLKTDTSAVSLHVQGMEWVRGPQDDGSFVGNNHSSLAVAAPDSSNTQTYTLFARQEGTFLLYTLGDPASLPNQLSQGLFGALNVEPAEAEWYRSQVTQQDLKLVTTGNTAGGHPIIDYNAVYPEGSTYPDGTPIPANTPILKMLDNNLNIVHTDLSAMITGPKAGRFSQPEVDCDAASPGIDPLFCRNPALPDRRQPYREFTIIYHDNLSGVSQAFPIFNEPTTQSMMSVAKDGFAINYGSSGLGAEIYANRIGVGPMGNCVNCKFQEFFLSAWTVGDPAMLVDKPANSNQLNVTTAFAPPCNTTASFNSPPCGGQKVPASQSSYEMKPTAKATVAFFPEDPSNVHHSYINDHAKFRILNAGNLTHVHHQHAHQWLQSPNSDQSSYLDSQMISPGASYTLEMVYNGSGNRNKVVGDSLFHCHFYPHFAGGLWAMWRTHDVFESGTVIDKTGAPVKGARALPDGEIKAGTPIPAVVPLPTLPMAPMPSPVFIDQGQIVFGTPTAPDPNGKNVKENPGFPFFIPGVAGSRAPHPPLDFAPDGKGGFLDGGLPRHIVTGGSIKSESHSLLDWSKDLDTVKAVQLPEEGTAIEKVAIGFFSKRCHETSFPDGRPSNCAHQPKPSGFIVNGLPLGPQSGAPFADPAVDDDGNAVNSDPATKQQQKRIYKGAAIQMDVVFNKKRWHFPQQRLLTLWNDVVPTISKKRAAEPLFIRGNSGDIIEYWHTNLVPNYYKQDNFQVRTPTDILGQHIHLVKFDVTSSSGTGTGFNYEDGTFSPDEVQELIAAINKSGGSWTPCPGCSAPPGGLKPKPPPEQICLVPIPPPQCVSEWLGAQTTIQRWYLDPLVDNKNQDRTLRTAFTHDSFGSLTHQQAGLYGGLLVEPKGSKWTSNDDDDEFFGTRSDGGPTSWQARIITEKSQDSYREFILAFQDLQLAYTVVNALGPPPRPQLISVGNIGTQSINYSNEPIPFRIGSQSVFEQSPVSDLSFIFDNSIQKAVNPLDNPDPVTPLMRAYQNDNIQLRVLMGAHLFSHQFNLFGPTWFVEPSWKNSGYRSAQTMGPSEHFELLFKVPSSSAPNTPRRCPDGTSNVNCVDYLYSPSFNESGLTHGSWGLFRAYDPTRITRNLAPLPNNPIGPYLNVTHDTCPKNAPKTTFNITAVTAQRALAQRSPMEDPGKGQIVFNDRDVGHPSIQLRARLGIMYVRSEDLDNNGRLKPGVPVEPLILRANAGDCIDVNLTNAIEPDSDVLKGNLNLPFPFNGPPFPTKVSRFVGLRPQLLSYDAATSSGINIGWNSQAQPALVQVVQFGKTARYQWYAGKIDRATNGRLIHTPVEFGALNLFPSDTMLQNSNGLFGSLIVEPQGATWQCGEWNTLANCDPSREGPAATTRASATVTLPDNTQFREFAVMLSDSMRISQNNSSAVNYRTEPLNFRYAGRTTSDFSCMLSNQLFQVPPRPSTPIGDPKTPIFTANAGSQVRFRMTHPFGTGTSQVFTVNGHVWQRNPYNTNSTKIGSNIFSQWIGSRDNHGSSDHSDLVIEKAGGEGGLGGDYLYSVFLPSELRQGVWGIFRVNGKGSVPQSKETAAGCKPLSP